MLNPLELLQAQPDCYAKRTIKSNSCLSGTPSSKTKKPLLIQEKLLIGLLLNLGKPETYPQTTQLLFTAKKSSPVEGSLVLHPIAIGFAVWTRLELATPCVTGRYSNQLNYQTIALLRGQIYSPFAFLQMFFENNLD